MCVPSNEKEVHFLRKSSRTHSIAQCLARHTDTLRMHREERELDPIQTAKSELPPAVAAAAPLAANKTPLSPSFSSNPIFNPMVTVEILCALCFLSLAQRILFGWRLCTPPLVTHRRRLLARASGENRSSEFGFGAPEEAELCPRAGAT